MLNNIIQSLRSSGVPTEQAVQSSPKIVEKKEGLSLKKEPSPPRTFGAYAILELMGSNKSSTQYKAIHKVDALSHGTPIQLNVFHRHISNDRTWRERLFDIVHHYKSLHHPHLIEILNLHIDDEQAALIIEDFDGYSLETICQNRTLNFNELMTFITPIFQALAALHKNSLAHRNIRLRTMLLTLDGQVKLSVLNVPSPRSNTLRMASSLSGDEKSMDPTHRDITQLSLAVCQVLTARPEPELHFTIKDIQTFMNQIRQHAPKCYGFIGYTLYKMLQTEAHKNYSELSDALLDLQIGHLFHQQEIEVGHEELYHRLICIPPGKQSDTSGRSYELQTHLLVGVFAIRNQFSSKVMGLLEEGNPAGYSVLSWIDAVLFCILLNDIFNLEQSYQIKKDQILFNPKTKGYRLLTVSEWDYLVAPSLIESDRIYTLQQPQPKNTSTNQGPLSFYPNNFGLYDASNPHSPEWVWGNAQSTNQGQSINIQQAHLAKVILPESNTTDASLCPKLRICRSL